MENDFKCLHCGFKPLTKNGLCYICKDIPSCSVCEIMLGTPDEDRENIVYTVYNTPSSLVEGRCTECENFESRIKNRCFVCGEFFGNKESWFRLHGNTCGECEFKTIQNLRMLKQLTL